MPSLPDFAASRAIDLTSTVVDLARSPEIDASAGDATATGAAIKWHPGHYVRTFGFTTPTNDGWPGREAELDCAGNNDNVFGWHGSYSWADIETGKGQYDFTDIDRDLGWLTTHYATPKRIAIDVSPGMLYAITNGSNPTKRTGYIPDYLLADPAYGPGTTAGTYGYWSASTAMSTSSEAALFRPAVMDRHIALMQALGARYDGNPYFEVMILPETAGYSANLSTAPDWSNDMLIAQLERLIDATVAAFPHTTVVMQNNYVDTQDATAVLTQYLGAHRAGMSGPDIWGASAVTKYGASKGYTWGQQALVGLTEGVPDLRGTMPVAHDIQSPELDGTSFGNIGSPFAPSDLFANADGNLHATHLFWNYIGENGDGLDSSAPTAGSWTSVLATINAHPLTHTECPSNYAGRCGD